MEPIIWMSVGASAIVALIVVRLAVRHGWAWLRAQLFECVI